MSEDSKPLAGTKEVWVVVGKRGFAVGEVPCTRPWMVRSAPTWTRQGIGMSARTDGRRERFPVSATRSKL